MSYGRLGDGIGSMIVVLMVFAAIGLVSIVALIAIAANTWDCTVKIERETTSSGVGES